MKDQVLDRAKRVWQAFLSFTPGQKAVTVAAVLALAIGGYLFSGWASTPTYAPLFTNLAPTDASAIVDKLNASKTPYQLAANGTEILVPQADVYSLRLTMSSAGLPTSGTSGYNLLDKEGVTTSEFKQHIDYQRALEGELAKTIKSINGITDAQVHLAIPQDTVFSDGTTKPTASVLITTAPGSTLAGGQVQSIVNLVSSSVSGLTADQVSVADAAGHILSASGADSSAQLDARSAATTQMNKQLASSIQLMMDNLVGAGHSVVTVNADLNFDKTSTTSSNYVYNSSVPALAEASSVESYGGTAANGGGVLGATSPSPTATGAGSSGGSGYLKTNVTKNNAVGQVTTNSSAAPGNIRTLSVAVLLDKNAPAVSEAAIRALVTSGAGLNTARGDSLAVQAAPFDTSATAAATKAQAAAAKAQAAAASKASLMSMIKTGLLVLAVLIVLLMVFLANRRRGKDSQPDELDMFLSTLNSNPDALPPAPRDIVAGPTPSPEHRQADAIQEKLTDMADTDPQEVARLLRNWLNAKDG
jgi:flagellar M-ring protein FliF